MNCQEIDILFLEYMDSKNPDLKNKIDALVESDEDCRKRIRELEAIHNELNSVESIIPDQEMDEMFHKMLDQEKELAPGRTNQKPLHAIFHWYNLAAGLIILILGITIGLLIPDRTGSEDILSIKEDIEQMKDLVLLSGLKHDSPSERIQAVKTSYDFTQADPRILQALIHTMNFDKNINVRLAAAQALFRFGNISDVRTAFIESLTIQDNPNMQITLIDMLVDLNEKSAIEEFQRLLQKDETFDIVRRKAESGIVALL